MKILKNNSLCKKLFWCGLMAVGSLAPSVHADIDATRSLLITDTAILDRFTLNRALQKLLNDSGDVSKSPQALLDTWPAGAGCDNNALFNGFPTSACRKVGMSNVLNYKTIAISNRFDLAPANGADCGEYRIAFALDSDNTGVEVNFVIMEARLPNPTPSLGLQGCFPVASFWAGLSSVADINTRATQLDNFYFNGLPGFKAIIDADNYRGSENGSGQIRINQRVSRLTTWSFFEFRTQRQPGLLNILQSTVKDNPFPALANGGSDNAAARTAFQNAVLDALNAPGAKLLANTMSTLSYQLPDIANTGSGFGDAFGTALNGGVMGTFATNSAFANAIQAKLSAIGSPLSPQQIIARVNALSCGGCHNNGVDLGAPLTAFNTASQNLEMLSFKTTTDSPTRYPVKDSLKNIFLPERKAHLEKYINTTNKLINGDFSSVGTGWQKIIDPSANASITIGGVYGDARVNSAYGGTQNWHVQLYQGGLKLEQGKTYRLSFDGGTFGKTLRANFTAHVEKNGPGYTQYMPLQAISVTPATRNFSFTFTMTQPTDSNARVTFNMGLNNTVAPGVGSVFSVDNVKLVELGN